MDAPQAPLNAFYQILDDTIEEVWRHESLFAHLQAMAEGLETLAEAAIKQGDEASMEVEEASQLLLHQLLRFRWAEHAKAFLILWRNMQVQLQKAHILYLDREITEETRQALKQRNHATAREAAEEFKNVLSEELSEIRAGQQGEEGQLAQWKLQIDPWPVYREQLEKLGAQGHRLLEQHQDLAKVAAQFREIRELIRQTCLGCSGELQTIQELAEKTIGYIKEQVPERPGKIPVYIDDVEEDFIVSHHLQTFTESLDEKINDLPGKTLQTPIATRAGVIQYKEIAFGRTIRQWIDSEIAPLLFEVWELTEAAINGFKMALVNIRNRSLLLAGDKKEGDPPRETPEDLPQPLHAFLQKIEGWQAQIGQLDELVQDRQRKYFALRYVYDQQQSFLPIPLQSTLNQFRFGQNFWLERLQRWWQRQRTQLHQLQLTVEREESLSNAEKIVRFIQSRRHPDTDSQYAGIFLTRGYIGESFWVGRADELERVGKLVEQWREGYRGAILLSGQRLSGKSLFGDTICNRFFQPEQIVRLQPNARITVQSRRLDTKKDLGAALDFIQKHTLRHPSVIWIDDLELWSDTDHGLATNARRLCRIIDNYSHRLFFIVSMSNAMRAHLHDLIGFNLVFQAVITLDYMPLPEVREAILIRHGATHKKLLNAEREDMSPQLFGRLTRHIHRMVRGNIGEALNMWAAGARKLSEESITYQPLPNYTFPDALHADSALLMATVVLEKRTNEYLLRKRFGPAFRDKYAHLLQRLLSVGLLERDLEGWLEVNEVAANPVGRLLQRKNYLNYQH